MKNFVLEIFDDGFPLVVFYTVRWDESIESETNAFIRHFATSTEFKLYYDQLAALLMDMGERKSARWYYFSRHEREATALPPKNRYEIDGIEIDFFNNPLRLYCLRINDHLVILFNGGLKSARTAQDSADLSRKFREAQQFARRIRHAIQEEMILIDETSRRITNFDGTTDEIIL